MRIYNNIEEFTNSLFPLFKDVEFEVYKSSEKEEGYQLVLRNSSIYNEEWTIKINYRITYYFNNELRFKTEIQKEIVENNKLIKSIMTYNQHAHNLYASFTYVDQTRKIGKLAFLNDVDVESEEECQKMVKKLIDHTINYLNTNLETYQIFENIFAKDE